MPMPTEPVDGALPSDPAAPSDTATGDAATGSDAPRSFGPPVALVREVQGPSSDRGRVAGLAMVCSAAGVALGFALAGSLFAAMTPPRTNVGPAGWSHCPGQRYYHGDYVRPAVHQARPLLGVTLNVPDDQAPPVLTGVFSGAPAALVGLRPGDRIVRFDGEPIESARELIQRIQVHRPGDLVSLEARTADGRTLNVESLRLATLPAR